eukprot:6672534-Alexandrium_andersonii.AAC.1
MPICVCVAICGLLNLLSAFAHQSPCGSQCRSAPLAAPSIAVLVDVHGASRTSSGDPASVAASAGRVWLGRGDSSGNAAACHFGGVGGDELAGNTGRR